MPLHIGLDAADVETKQGRCGVSLAVSLSGGVVIFRVLGSLSFSKASIGVT